MKHLLLLPSLLTLISFFPLHAAEIPWKPEKYSLQVREEALNTVLQNFCADQGIYTIISEQITGTVSGQFTQLDPADFLNRLTAAYNLIWYYDGTVLYIYHSSEMASEMLTMQFAKIDRYMMALDAVQILDQRFPIRALESEGLVYVTGPPRYVELAVQTAVGMDANAARMTALEASRDVVEVFELKYAWADDQLLSFNDREITVPGVVTVLRGILTGSTGLETLESRDRRRKPTRDKLKGKGMSAIGNLEDDEAEDLQAQNSGGDESPQTGPPTPVPMIMADVRNNAVVVRDKGENIAFYRQIIESLDVPAGLIEIHASIIEVNTDYSHEVGVDWRYEKPGDASAGYFNNAANEADADFNFNNSPLTAGAGLSFTTILGDAAENFIARIRLLEADGKADIISRPSIVTLDNVEAQLTTNQTFFVRLEGDREVDLFNVSAGVTLRVTPHLIEDGKHKKIKLSIQLEDGSVTENRVDAIPIVQNTTINTQAVIRHNESVLLGGYVLEKRTDTESRVPFFGRIPLFGNLFRNKTRRNEMVERLILLTPRIIDPENPSRFVEVQPRYTNELDSEELPLDIDPARPRPKPKK
ncbi:type III secretion system outer membrane ring subunit SctC [Acanthopleuribacter pedis]|uniref:Type 3 secretion system secretin n=1 Tax=Acanthopleuribacter pedis TaxID=442870 RepID=A0A8J7QKC6_9BACT|nr:type III secretion system outer membrane ring subunit SctC [Acanthopleuribacter pedis]